MELLDSLKTVIAQDAALSCNLASCQAWIDRNGQTASLDEIADNLEDAKAEVSDYTFDGLRIKLSEFVCRVLKGPCLSLQKSFS